MKKWKINELSNLSHFRACYSNFNNIEEISTHGTHKTVLPGFFPLINKKV
jgi:hypothetical protein